MRRHRITQRGGRRHRANNNCSVGGRGSETQIKPFYVFERRKELDGGAVGRVVMLQNGRMFSAIRREGDDTIVIFEVAGARSV
jgi:hypothetical protein